MFAGLVLEAGEWRWPVVFSLLVAVALAWWGYRRSPLEGPLRYVGILLRALGAAIILICLLEPMWTSQRARPGANWFTVLVDNSQGMQIYDPGSDQSRGEAMKTMLNTTADGWQDSLAENFQVRDYIFDSRLQSIRDFKALDFSGNGSALIGGLQSVRERFRGMPLAGILVFTDGNATDYLEGVADFSALPPIYPVVIGGDEPVKDLAIRRISVSQTAFEDAPVTITAEVTANGFKSKDITVSLTQQKLAGPIGTNAVPGLSQTQIKPVTTDEEILSFRFQLQPQAGNIHFYELNVQSEKMAESDDQTVGPDEATLVNNKRLVMVDRGQGPYRILYVAGRPNWEYKFLNRALQDDDQLRLVGLIRMAPREARFEFRGRSGETSNPLFRGFGDQSVAETEQYDQAVIKRLNTRDADELRGGFPRTAAELYPYHAIILDDVESSFFRPDQLALMEKFVTDRGGGFLMLGGQESFQEGGYNNTPVGNMLPVYLRDNAQFGRPTAPLTDLHLNLTREGWLQPWARVRSTESEERYRLDALPGFKVLNSVSGIKPGASVIATVTDSGGEVHPGLAVQKFGNGRTGAMMIGDFWRSTLHSAEQKEDVEKTWRQIARWLVTDVSDRITFSTKPDPALPGSMLLSVKVRNDEYKPLDSASVKILVRQVASDDSTNSASFVELIAEPVATEPGLFTAGYVQHDSGGYLAEAIVQDEKGIEVGRKKSGWVSEPAAEEFRSLTPNRSLLEQIARQTGGQVVEQDDLESFVTSLPTKKAPMMETSSRPLWHNPWIFLLALACFIGEWALRRKKGLA